MAEAASKLPAAPRRLPRWIELHQAGEQTLRSTHAGHSLVAALRALFRVGGARTLFPPAAEFLRGSADEPTREGGATELHLLFRS